MANVYRSTRPTLGLLLGVIWLGTIPGCPTIQPPDDNACATDADCSDGEFCNGQATCSEQGTCVQGVPPCDTGVVCNEDTDRCELPCVTGTDCADGDPCTEDSCEDGICRHGEIPACQPFPPCTADVDCDDGTFCNGAETCDADGRCQIGTDPCPGQLCRETDNTCVDCIDDGNCRDGTFCNGAETCDAGGVCQPGADPCVVTQFCDKTADRCVSCAKITDCPGAPDCVLPTHSVAVAECDVPFCPPVARLIRVVNEEGEPGLQCTGWGGGSESCQGNDVYQAFKYESEDLFLYISFGPEIVGQYSNDAFHEHFHHIWLNVYFPPHPPAFFHQVSAIRSIDFFDEFRYDNGRLYGSLTFDILRVLQRVQSSDPDCFYDDILGECYCDYRDLVIPTRIEFDLSVEGSDIIVDGTKR